MEENPDAQPTIEVVPGTRGNAGDLVVVTTIIESVDEDSTSHPEVGKELAIDTIPAVQSSSNVLIGTKSILDNVQKDTNASQTSVDKLPKDRSTPVPDINRQQKLLKSLEEMEQPQKQYKPPLKGFKKPQKHGHSPFKDIEQISHKSLNSIEQPEKQCESPIKDIDQAHDSESLLNDADFSQESNSLSTEGDNFQKESSPIDKDIDSRLRLLYKTPINLPEKAQKGSLTRCEDNSINVNKNEVDHSAESMNMDDSKDTTTSESEICENIEPYEKEHKSISRELKSLIASAKESKIINECTQLTSKIRKSRALDSPNTSLDVIRIARRSSTNSLVSNSSDISERPTKRSMRSQNPEFVSKHKQFLNAVTGKNNLDLDSGDEAKQKTDDSLSKTSKKRRLNASSPNKAPSPAYMNKYLKSRSDPYCWRCHWSIEPESNEKAPSHCSTCPRSFHFKCLNTNEKAKLSTEKTWSCVECLIIENENRSKRKYTVEMLCELLEHACTRLCKTKGVEPFITPVDLNLFPDYEKYVVHPMDLTVIRNNIRAGVYASTKALVSDMQWILHNSIIFNTRAQHVTLQSHNAHAKLTGMARYLVRMCRMEMGEIEACPECYAGAHVRPLIWFTEVCSEPHLLLWAKLKGFPYWPAKGLSVNNSGLVDVRFFGAHDRAWVPPRDCYLYSMEDPNGFRTKRQDILDSVEEAQKYIKNIITRYGSFVHAPFKTIFDPTILNEQLHLMIPGFQGEVTLPKNVIDKLNGTASPSNSKTYRRSNSMLKSSKSSIVSGDPSDDDDETPASKIRKTDNATVKHEVTNSRRFVRARSVGSSEKPDKPPVMKDKCKKRRKSMVAEAVISIADTEKQSYKMAEFNIVHDNVNTSTPKQLRISNLDEKLTQIQDIPKLVIKKSYSKTSTPKDKVKDGVITLKSQSREEKSTPKSVNTIDKVISENNFDADKSINKDKNISRSSKENTEKDTHMSKEITKDKSTKLQRRRSYKKPVPNAVTSDKESTENKSQNLNKSVNETKGMVISEKNKVTNKSATDKVSPLKSKSIKEGILFDDDTSLAVLAQQVNNSIAPVPGFPTISNIRSLSDASAPPSKSNSPGVDASIAVIAKPNSVSNAKESTSKTKKATDPPVRRLEVRSFAKMTSPPRENDPASIPASNSVQIEIKAEPVDFDDPERQTAKLDLMSSVNLRPVQRNTQHTDMTINKVVAGAGIRQVNKPVEMKPKAKKTFPQAKKVDDSKTDLNSKNTMVYIPIQSPVSQAPACPASRAPACPASRAPACPASRAPAPLQSAPSATNPTVQRPMGPMGTICSTSMSMAGVSPPMLPPASSALSALPAPTVPTTVHTLPLITTVNGQWTLSLQPMMSVGNLDVNSMPLVNGITDRPNNSIVAPQTIVSNQPANPTESVGLANTQFIEQPPRPQQRLLQNPLDPTAPLNDVPTPSSAGATTAKLNQNAVKLTDFFRNLLEDSIERTDSSGAQLTKMKLQLEQLRWRYMQEMEEIKHNNELMMMELRTSVEKERARIVTETRRACQLEMETAVNFAKSKQWCAICRQEAQFYCCWNTSYCNYTCQRAHWAQHFSVCTQQRPQDGNIDRRINPLDNRLHPLEVAPRTVTSSIMTVGGKSVTTTVAQRNPSSAKPSLIVSVVEDASGASTVKCLGSFKPNSMPSTLLNNQIRSTEENAKKVMTTSGGYLIVGTSTPSNTNLLLQ